MSLWLSVLLLAVSLSAYYFCCLAAVFLQSAFPFVSFYVGLSAIFLLSIFSLSVYTVWLSITVCSAHVLFIFMFCHNYSLLDSSYSSFSVPNKTYVYPMVNSRLSTCLSCVPPDLLYVYLCLLVCMSFRSSVALDTVQ